jgi:hypothetical protein
MTLVTSLAILLANGLLRALVAGAGIAIACVCFCALAWGGVGGIVRAGVAVAFGVGLALAVWSLLAPRPHPPEAPRPPMPPRPLVEPLTHEQVALGVHPRSLVSTTAGLLAVTDSGLVALQPRPGTDAAQAVPIDGTIAAMAADDAHIVVAYGGDRGGYAAVFDARSYRQLRSMHYSEVPGSVALGDDAAWLCNVTHEKLDRLDLATGAFREYEVPGTPNDVLIAAGAAWVTIAGGWLERIDLASGRITVQRTEDDPEQLTFAFGLIWISHPENRVLTRADPETGAPVGAPIPVRADTHQAAALRGSLFAISGATDMLQRIDPRRARVIGTTRLPTGPSGIVTLGKRLYVTSEGTGTVVPVAVRSRR